MNCSWFDFTIWLDDMIMPEDDYKAYFNEFCDRFAWGHEFAPKTGRAHLQGRAVLSPGIKLSRELINEMAEYHIRHITPTHTKNFDYVLKDGDFYESWNIPSEELTNIELFDWQKQLIEMPRDSRHIHILIDHKGGLGKTTFCDYLRYKHLAVVFCPMSKPEYYAGAFINSPPSDWYVFDLPRGQKLDPSFWSVVEQVKNGRVCDPRYNYKERDIHKRPKVLIMTNEDPDAELSDDRVVKMQVKFSSLAPTGLLAPYQGGYN